MQSIILFALLLIAVSVSAAPLERRNGLTCVNTLTAGAFTTMQCNCLASCFESDFCCNDYESFTTSLKDFASRARSPISALVAATTVPEFHKVELAITRSATYKNTMFLTVRSCVFEDELKLRQPGPGATGLTVMPKWIMRSCSDEYDVFAHLGNGQFATFEQAVRVPSSVRIALGPIPPAPGTITILPFPLPWDVLYYAEVTGPSAVAAYKMSLTREEPVAGFRAELCRQADGKLPWDPTTGRTWAVQSATLSTTDLVQFATTTQDVSAHALDMEFAETAESADYRVSPTKAFLRRVFDGRQWADVINKDGQREVPQL